MKGAYLSRSRQTAKELHDSAWVGVPATREDSGSRGYVEAHAAGRSGHA